MPQLVNNRGEDSEPGSLKIKQGHGVEKGWSWIQLEWTLPTFQSEEVEFEARPH